MNEKKIPSNQNTVIYFNIGLDIPLSYQMINLHCALNDKTLVFCLLSFSSTEL